MQFTMTAGLSAWVSDRIANYLAEATEQYQRWEAAAVSEFAALPLIRHWEETIGLRSDGSVIRWSDVDNRNSYSGTKPVDEKYDWLSALVDGARKYPELQVLLPIRPSGAVDCICIGHQGFAPGKAICPYCCGLRWVDSPE